MPEATPHSHRGPARVGISRRGFLVAGVAGASAAAVPSLASAGSSTLHTTTNPNGPTSPAGAAGTALPPVRPISSRRAHHAFGVCSHPNFGNAVYKNTDAWMEALAKTGATYFRGLYADGLSATKATTAAARKHGIEWGATVCPEDWSLSDAGLIRRINDIAENAADICLFVEGVNEPNHERDGSKAPSDWVQRTVQKQRIIWNTVRGDSRLDHVKVVGPSLHAVAATEADYQALGDAGLARYMNFAGLHRYPGGRYPNYLLDERLTWIQRHWSGKRTWITETGYTNSLASRSGHAPVPEDISARYAPSAVLEAIDRDCKVCWYELLDDPDARAKDVVESNFGMYEAESLQPPFRAKPVVGVMRAFLDGLRDDGPWYTPEEIPLKITSVAKDVRSTVIGRRDGSVSVYLRRSIPCWDIKTDKRITVPLVDVTIETATGSQKVKVDDEVRAVRL